MPVDAEQKLSLAYRRHQAAIEAGHVPEKYTRLLPYITGRRILEIGSAEGVLALLLADSDRHEWVTGLELREDRHEEALRLQVAWSEAGRSVKRCALLWGDIRDRLDLLRTADTLVAIRSIYYLREDASRILAAAAASGSISRIVLCGNRGRQRRYQDNPHDELGRFNRLASIDGMTALLRGAGYLWITVVDEGDPIVVGRHPRFA